MRSFRNRLHLSRSLRFPAAIVCLSLMNAACDLPRDPNDTLDAVRGGTMTVGVSEAPPWIVRQAPGDRAAPGGIEAALVQSLADELDADLQWVWGPPADHVEALHRFELDLVVGGHTKESPLARGAGRTSPWFVSSERRGRNHVVRKHHLFLVPPGENGWIVKIDDQLKADSALVMTLTDSLSRGEG